jgi:hypothetical protein
MINKAIFVLIIAVGFWSCASHHQPGTASAVAKDTTPPRDTASRTGESHLTPDAAENSEGESLNDILQAYLKRYKDTVKVDTTLVEAGKDYVINFRHYCTFDSAIVVPDKYVSDYGMNEFRTHDFESHLKILSGAAIAVDTIISKKIFVDQLSTATRTYGVLLFPHLSFSEQGILIRYTVNIPLTDVGPGVSLMVGYNGSMTAKGAR